MQTKICDGQMDVKILELCLYICDFPKPDLDWWRHENTPCGGFIWLKAADSNRHVCVKTQWNMFYQVTVHNEEDKWCYPKTSLSLTVWIAQNEKQIGFLSGTIIIKQI